MKNLYQQTRFDFPMTTIKCFMYKQDNVLKNTESVQCHL